MAERLRDRVARALVWTTDQIESGRGKSQVRVMDMYLGDIQKHLGRSIPDALPRYALRIDVAEEDLGGPEVVLGKKRSGLFVLTEDGFLLARDAGWARTLTEGFQLEGCRAEPVACIVKGKKTAGFRITGRSPGLIALDPAIGGGSDSQARIRDRIVSTFNGEVQASPDQRGSSGYAQTALPRLVSLPSTTSEDPCNPPLDEEGQLVLDAGELILYKGEHRCEALRNEPVAYGRQWRVTLGPATPADVWITNRRVAVCWKDWSGDPSAAQLIERYRRAGFVEAAEESAAVAAQLMVAWVAYVYVGRTDNSLEFQASDQGMWVRLKLCGVEPAEAERLMREAAVAVASYRLATDDTVKLEETEALQPVANGQPTVEELDWGLSISLPSSYRIGRDPASRPPDTT